ncbi:MAG TPA: MlaD family protein [Bryobacteraceae bacterium]|nr:MlaD family protein [Bryobacteraceae bacterium]
MAAEKSYARLGLFLVVGMIVILATALFFIQRMRSRDVISAVTYTRENVSGLEVSSPVRYRGVSVGRITDVRVDPRSNSIEVIFEIFLDRLVTVGANVERIQEAASGGLFEKLRSQIVRNPVTGESYLLLDRPEEAPPPIELGFTPDRAYVPSMPTMLSKVEDRLPEVLERAAATLQTLREIVAKAPATLDRTERFFTNIEKVLQESDIPALSADSRKFLTTTSTQLAQMERITSELSRLIESQEAFTKFIDDTRVMINAVDLPATTRSARDSADRTSLAADDLRRSLPAMRDSLEELRQLARFLGQQPESVIYGPRNAGAKAK